MKPFTLIAAAIFVLLALVHAYRIVVGFPVVIGSSTVGQGISGVAMVVGAVMAIGLL